MCDFDDTFKMYHFIDNLVKWEGTKILFNGGKKNVTFEFYAL